MPQPTPVPTPLYLATALCPTKGWLHHHTSTPPTELPDPDEDTYDPTAQVQPLEWAALVGAARARYPRGREARSPVASPDDLAKLPDVAFSVRFISGSPHDASANWAHTATSDILVRTPDADTAQAFELISITKSLKPGEEGNEEEGGAKTKERKKPELIDKLARQALVAETCGARIVKATQLRITKAWRHGSPANAIYVPHDCTTEVRARAAELRAHLAHVPERLAEPQAPPHQHLHACKKCEFRTAHCHGIGVEHPIYELPRLSESAHAKFIAAGIFTIKDIPAGYKVSDGQRLVVDAVQQNAPVVNEQKLQKLLAPLCYPAFHLDFETVTFPMPPWAHIAPYEPIETQYSLHREESPGAEPNHSEYLAPHTHDARRELAQRLLHDLEVANGSRGSIVVYSNFEEQALKRLAKKFPDLEAALMSCVERLFDLEKVIKGAVCHPGFGGRTSIKAVLPVMVPGMSYEGLEIRDGLRAVEVFKGLVFGVVSGEDVERVRRGLLDYCGRDSAAMVGVLGAVRSL